jgi:hypothetical protein
MEQYCRINISVVRQSEKEALPNEKRIFLVQ